MLKKFLVLSLSVLTVNYNLQAAEPKYPLHKAAESGYVALVKELLKHCDVNQKDYCGLTPLLVATDTRNLQVIRLLLADPLCNINAKDNIVKIGESNASTCVRFFLIL